eukprot:6176242-Pleurochrysis_carterae.AAC.2
MREATRASTRPTTRMLITVHTEAVCSADARAARARMHALRSTYARNAHAPMHAMRTQLCAQRARACSMVAPSRCVSASAFRAHTAASTSSCCCASTCACCSATCPNSALTASVAAAASSRSLLLSAPIVCTAICSSERARISWFIFSSDMRNDASSTARRFAHSARNASFACSAASARRSSCCSRSYTSTGT